MDKSKGFNLIELMVVLAIVGILVGIAYPSYTNHVVDTRRTEAEVALVNTASKMERYYTENKHTYRGATLKKIGALPNTTEKYYKITLTGLTPTTYTIKAIPQKSQNANDKACGTLTYNELGEKGITGTGSISSCW